MINRNFLIIVLGQIISLFGSAIQRFSMSLYLLEFTGSTATFANILAISTLPYILFAPIAGRLTDRMNRKKIMVWLDFLCSLLIGAYAFVLFEGKDHVGIVAVVMFLLSVSATLYGPAVAASIPQVVSEEKLTSANGIVNQVGAIVNFAGPILAGVLYGLMGIKLIVVINAVSFLASAIMELFLKIPDIVGAEKAVETEVIIEAQEKKGAANIKFVKDSFVDMKESFKYLKKEKQVILGIIISYALGNIFLVPILSIVAPFFINVKLGLPSQVYGFVEGICVLGMILGGFWISVKPKLFKIEKAHYTYFPMIVGVFMMSAIGFMHLNAYVLAGLFAFSGLAIMLSLSLSNVLTLTFIQKEIPAEMLGRVSALSTAVATVSVAPGQLLFGQIIETGMPIGIILLITALANIGVVMFVRWNVRNI
ncbi:MFS transporter [Cellulosilyticum ruminicola]|uniref:MFS transporter n=1 Tax=Cellulosilyticum ruminicola TaxID=425254 RepID=UPI0006D0E37C|nr:MFS transporter [Cellulosilyticum ruminicola]